MTINIIDEFERALEEQHLTKKELSGRLHVTQAALSNWVSRDGAIPSDKLIPTALAIGSDRFLDAAVEYATDGRLRVFADDVDTDDPLVLFLKEKMAHAQFERCAQDAESALATDPRKRCRSDFEKIDQYIDAGDDLVEHLESFLGTLRQQKLQEVSQAWM